MSKSLWPHGLQHVMFPCPPPNPHSLLKLLSIHLVIPSDHLILCWTLLIPPSIIPSIRVFPMSQLFTSQSIGTSPSASVLPMNSQNWFPLECSPRDSQESSSKPKFKSINSFALSFLYGWFHIHTWLLEKQKTLWAFVGKVMSLLFNMQRLVI